MPYAPGVVDRSGEIMYKGLSDTFDRYDMLKKAKEEQDRLEKLRLESIRQFDLGEARANMTEGRLQAANNEAIRQFGVNSDLAHAVERRAQAGDTERSRQFDLGEARANMTEGRLQAGDDRAATAAQDTSSMSAAQLEALRLKIAEDTPMEGLNGNFGNSIMGQKSDITKAVEDFQALIGRKASVAEVKKIAERIDKAKDAQALVAEKGLYTPTAQGVAEIERMGLPKAEEEARIKAFISKDRRRITPSTPSQFDAKRVN